MSMKKLLACLDDANVDDQSPAVEDDANTGAGAGTPLETMTFVEVPEYIVGSRWEFCGGFVNGTEMSDEQATNTLKGCNGVLEIDFNDVDAVGTGWWSSPFPTATAPAPTSPACSPT